MSPLQLEDSILDWATEYPDSLTGENLIPSKQLKTLHCFYQFYRQSHNTFFDGDSYQ